MWRLLQKDSYLVWTRVDGAWKVAIRSEAEIIDVIKEKVLPSGRGSSRVYIRDMHLIYGKSPEVMAEALIHHSESSHTEEHPPVVESYLIKLAQELVERAESMRKTTFTWKTAEQGTDLRAHPPATEHKESAESASKGPLDETIFKMDLVPEAAWYGQHYRA